MMTIKSSYNSQINIHTFESQTLTETLTETITKAILSERQAIGQFTTMDYTFPLLFKYHYLCYSYVVT